MQILYLCPELEAPSGGVDQIHQHVQLLCKVGLPAAVVHFTEGFRWPHAPDDVPVHGISSMRLSREDHLVLPEGWLLPELLELPLTKHLYCQGLMPMYNSETPPDFLPAIPTQNVLCCSKMLRAILTDFFGLQPTLVPNVVNPRLFRPAESKHKAVAYMPRKEKRFIYAVKGLFEAAHPHHRDVLWVPIDNMTKDETAATLGECSVFLSTSFFEGFGLPPLEAMACDTLVVGTHGYGGQEYVTETNGFWCDQADIPECARLLGRAFDMLETDGPATRAMRAAGRETVAAYTPDHQVVALLQYWQQRLKGHS